MAAFLAPKVQYFRLLYLSLSDMVQHSAGPGEELADSFNREVDKRVGRILELGAVVASG